MTDDTTNLVLEHLRAIRREQTLTREDIGELKARISGLEDARHLLCREILHGESTDKTAHCNTLAQQ